VGFTMRDSEVKDWWDQAIADLSNSKMNLKNKAYYVSVTLSQQAAEKALKALYLKLESKVPPKIHDLVELSRLVKSPIKITSSAEKLTITYFTSRYFGAGPEIPVKYYNLDKAKHHLIEAEEIIGWVTKKIQ